MSFAKIKAGEYPLSKIFSNEFVFKIPYYQRPYAWTTEEARELLEDLLESIDSTGRSHEELNQYFLGSIVLIKEDDSNAQVVDGQQRLATITILLSVLRDLCNNEKYLYDLNDYITQKGKISLKLKDTYRLTLSERDKEFFQKHIQTSGNIEQLIKLTKTDKDSQKNIRDNAKLFYNILKGNVKEGLKGKTEEERERLIDFIAAQCYMVVVSTPDSDSAYRIFSILNDRGLNLSHADILKSELIGKINEELHEDYAKMWEDTEDKLGRAAFIDLFPYIRMIKHRKKLRKDILNEFREYVIKPINDPRKVIEEIVKYGDIYEDIKKPAYESDFGAEAINAKLRWLNQIDNADWIPPAMRYMSLHNDDPRELIRFFSDLERLAAGLMILRADVNERIRRYGRILEAIENNQNLYEETPPLDPEQSLLQLTPNERKDIIDRLKGDLYLESQFRLYVLLRLDSALSAGGVQHDRTVITIEHVLPQNPKQGQWTCFPNPERCVHKLGNLVLLTRKKNPEASNYEFNEKKSKYFYGKSGVTSFDLTKQVILETSWTPEVVKRRQGELLDKLKEIWRL